MSLSNRDPPKTTTVRSLHNIFFGDTYYQVCAAAHTWYLQSWPELMQEAMARLERRWEGQP